MNLTEKAPQWDAAGTEPTTDLKQNGFAAGYKPPAPYFNYLFNKYTSCINEIQQELINVDKTGNIISKNYKIKYKEIDQIPYKKPKIAVTLNNEIHCFCSKTSSTSNHYKWNGTEWSYVSEYYSSVKFATVYNNEIYTAAQSGNIDKWTGTSWEVAFTPEVNDEIFEYRGLVVLNNELHVIMYNPTDKICIHFKTSNGKLIELNRMQILNNFVYNNKVIVYNNEIYIVNISDEDNIRYSLKFDGVAWNKTDFIVPEINDSIFDEDSFLLVYENNLHCFGSDWNGNEHLVYDGFSWKRLEDLPYKFYKTCVVFDNKVHMLGCNVVGEYTYNRHMIYSDAMYIENILTDNNYKVNDIYGANATVDIDTVNNYILGNDNIGQGNQMILGHYNNKDNATAGATTGVDGTALCVGNGTSTTRANAFRVNYDGSVFGLSSFNASGADFAEFREWLDGNENNEDRVGYFVTREGLKIRKANAGEYVAGVTSGNPCIVGNSDECWRGKYETDNFNRFIEETYEYEEEVNGATVTKTGTRYKVSPNYDPEQEYIERAKRKEWAYVCMRGEIAVYDDGTCKVNEYCKVANGGIATAAQVADYSFLTPIYRVVERVADNIIKIEY